MCPPVQAARLESRGFSGPPRAVGLALLSATLALTGGCGGSDQAATIHVVRDEPTIRVVRPDRRTIVRTVGQPGFVDAYEQTSLYAKLPGYVEKWNVDIGDRISKGQVMAEIFVPELLEEHKQKQSQVALDKVMVEQARKIVEVAESDVKSAAAELDQAKADLLRFQAEVERWDSEVERLTKMVAERVVDRQVLAESERQQKSSASARDAAQAAIQTKAANLQASESSLAKAKVDVDAAAAKVAVSEADERRLAALVGYTQIVAPYDGVVIVRNANTGDFVQPAQGDQSAAAKTADESASLGTPIYVVARTDVVRVYVDVPEMDANYVTKGTKARVVVQALKGEELPAEVTRTSWALHARSRTLRAEIDLKNPDATLLPGMYAYGRVLIERPDVRALPAKALSEIGDQICCYQLRDGKAVRIPVETGISDGTWVEIVKQQTAAGWEDIQGTEEIILGDLTELSDGQPVIVAPAEPAKVQATSKPADTTS